MAHARFLARLHSSPTRQQEPSGVPCLPHLTICIDCCCHVSQLRGYSSAVLERELLASNLRPLKPNVHQTPSLAEDQEQQPHVASVEERQFFPVSVVKVHVEGKHSFSELLKHTYRWALTLLAKASAKTPPVLCANPFVVDQARRSFVLLASSTNAPILIGASLPTTMLV